MEPAQERVKDTPITLSDEGQRLLCFELFNRFWDECRQHGISFDTVGTMSISAALVAIIASHGTLNTANFLDDLVGIVRSGEFNLPRHTAH